MLMQSFQSAADLGISEAQKEALMKTLVLLASCGDDYASYEKPTDPSMETEWHKCMRQNIPTTRHVCRDLK